MNEDRALFKSLLANYIAAFEDLEHVVECCERLSVVPAIADAILARALWESALISLRRTSANARPMGGSGKANNPVHRSKVSGLLSDHQQASYERLLEIADKVVAHRGPVDNQRTIDVLPEGDAEVDLYVANSRWAGPATKDVGELGDIAKSLLSATYPEAIWERMGETETGDGTGFPS